MKKILTTLTVIAATALGAQGQTTNTNFIQPNSSTYNFTNYTFVSNNIALTGGTNFTRVRLLMAVTGVNFGGFGRVDFNNFTLSGQGITGTLTGFSDVLINSNSATTNDASTYLFTSYVNLSTPISTWTAASNLITFRASTLGSAVFQPGSSIYYGLTYDTGDGLNLNSSLGNIAITAVPEPSAYAAAAGLLALFLWSSRRHLYKLAGARSSASGPDENGAA